MEGFSCKEGQDIRMVGEQAGECSMEPPGEVQGITGTSSAEMIVCNGAMSWAGRGVTRGYFFASVKDETAKGGK